MKLRNNKEYEIFDRVVSASKSSKASNVKKHKRENKRASVPRKTTELRIKLKRIDTRTVWGTRHTDYLKEIDQQNKEKVECYRANLKRIIEMTDHVKPVDALDLNGNVSENWRRFKRNYTIFATAARVDGQEDAIKISTFLNAIGPEAVELFDSFTLTNEQRGVYNTVVEAFERFCNPRRNVIFERYKFNQRNQHDGETFDEFFLELKKLARYCGFGDALNELIRDRIVAGITNNKLRERLLGTTNLTMDMAVEKARTFEETHVQSQAMSKTATATTSSIDEIRMKRQHVRYRSHRDDRRSNERKSDHANSGNRYNNNGNDRGHTNRDGSTNTHTNEDDGRSEASRHSNDGRQSKCTFCGFSHRPRSCPAYGKTCNKCSRKNHFEAVCLTRSIAAVSVSGSDDNDVFELN